MAKLNINKVSEEPEKEYARAAKKIVLGKERPPFFTRVILGVALVCFCYYFIWNGLRVMLLSDVNVAMFKARIQSFGEEYGIKDAISVFKSYGLAMVITWLVAAGGMALIWRRKLIGYYLFFAGMLGALVVPFVTTGWEYSTQGGVDWFDFVIPPVLGAIFYLSFKRLRKLKHEVKMHGV